MGLSKTRTINRIEPLSGDPLSGSDCRKKGGNLCRERAASSVPLIFLLEHARAPLRTTLLHTYPHCLGGGGRIFIVAKKRKEKKSGKFGLSWGGRDPCGRDEDVDDDDGTNRILPHYSIHPLLLSIRPSILPSFPMDGPPIPFPAAAF